MRDIYNEVLQKYGPHDPANKFQHPDFVTEVSARILETLAAEVWQNKYKYMLFNAYDHVMNSPRDNF